MSAYTKSNEVDISEIPGAKHLTLIFATPEFRRSAVGVRTPEFRSFEYSKHLLYRTDGFEFLKICFLAQAKVIKNDQNSLNLYFQIAPRKDSRMGGGVKNSTPRLNCEAVALCLSEFRILV